MTTGLASCQQHGGNTYNDQGRAPGGASGMRKLNPYGTPVDPYGTPVDPYGTNVDPYGTNVDPYSTHLGMGRQVQAGAGGNLYPDKGRAHGGSSRMKLDPSGTHPGIGFQVQAGAGGLNQVNAGNPPTGGSSRGQMVDFAPVGNPGPVQGQVNHVEAGAQPQGTGGNSGLQDIPLGPVQTGMHNNVNMVDMGSPPDPNQNSGEIYDYGAGAVGGAIAGNGAAVNGQTGDFAPNLPQTAGETVLGQTGGSSGNGGNAYNGGNYADNAGANAPLGGAEISDLTQQEAGKASHSKGVAGIGTTAAGVVIAVLVLVGIVGVAAVFLIRQRRSRMGMSQV